MKAQIAMSMIVLMAIALIALLLISGFFTGGFKAMGAKFTAFVKPATGNVSVTGEQVGCGMACSGWVAEGCPDSGPSRSRVISSCDCTFTAKMCNDTAGNVKCECK